MFTMALMPVAEGTESRPRPWSQVASSPSELLDLALVGWGAVWLLVVCYVCRQAAAQ